MQSRERLGTLMVNALSLRLCAISIISENMIFLMTIFGYQSFYWRSVGTRFIDTVAMHAAIVVSGMQDSVPKVDR